jgi:membrane-associated protease RseP (regulator of RpoE activity)
VKRLLFIFLMLLVGAAGCAKQPAAQSSSEAETVVRSFLQALSQGDDSTCLSLLADDVVFQQEPAGLKIEGKAQLEAAIHQLQGWHHQYGIASPVKTDGDRVSFTIKESGEDYRIMGLESVTGELDIRVVDGRIRSWKTTVSREDWQKITDLTAGRVGIKFELAQQGMKVKEVAGNSPAYQAGIRPGDVVIAVDGISYSQMREGEMQLRIQGPVGSHVRLTVTHEGAPSPREVEVTRVSSDGLRY